MTVFRVWVWTSGLLKVSGIETCSSLCHQINLRSWVGSMRYLLLTLLRCIAATIDTSGCQWRRGTSRWIRGQGIGLLAAFSYSRCTLKSMWTALGLEYSYFQKTIYTIAKICLTFLIQNFFKILNVKNMGRVWVYFVALTPYNLFNFFKFACQHLML